MSQSPLTKPEISSGTLIDNRYTIQKLLGQGGLGRTYLAFDTRRFNEPCVLKEFAPIGTGESGLEKCRDLFKREAKILHQLQHPQIPKFLACFEGDGRLFLVQEYVDGQTYSKLLQKLQKEGRNFSEDEIINWLKNLLLILEYIHEHNIIHRDISPDNVMLPDSKNVPVLIDFGVGKQIAGELNNTINSDQATFVGKMSLVGKVGYAPREQISLGLCSPSSDLYALGVTAAVLLTGRDPCLLMDQYSLEWKWRLYSDVSDAFAEVLDKMLADTPKNRYQTAKEVLTDLQCLKPEELQKEMNNAPSGVFVKELLTDLQCLEPEELEGEMNNAPTGVTELYSSELKSPDTIDQSVVNFDSLLIPPKKSQPQPVNSFKQGFIKLCQEQLAYHIGPIASLIIEETLAENSDILPDELVKLLAKEIPDSQTAFEFQQSFFSDY
ncbi:serine/threonine protein kinase [Scytonema hofmannii FACHB-248]|uniref:non-specific serine/threonine protein kinase n=1 Tax=Scytonema hofmannii FACHB-248 TaxID=1842502 RepID=A0ABR8GXS0_9CYAN|nr:MULTISPECIES: serine/threonine-protein kinase [Nostocales]MBD2607914.1 serine/threonine protein kinase [Scytonema hofmannii FACHB-248]